MDSTDTYGVVLAGGASTRMGHDKASLDIGGISLLERAVATLSEVCDVVVAGGPTSPDGVELIRDRHAAGGPLSGLDAAYTVATGRSIFLLGVDMPFVDAAAIREIIGPGVGATAARVPVGAGRMQPLCALYGADLGKVAQAHLESDDRSLVRFIDSLDDVEYIEMDENLFDNVNTEPDLAAALKRFGLPRNTH